MKGKCFNCGKELAGDYQPGEIFVWCENCRINWGGNKKIHEKVIKYEDYPIVNSIEHPLKDLIISLIDKGSVLDIGCGSGIIAKALQDKGLDIEGLDASEVAVNICEGKGLKMHLSTILDFNSGKKYDYVICIGTIYYLDKFEENFSKIISLLKEGGTLITNFYNPFRKRNDLIEMKVSKKQFSKAIKDNNLIVKKVIGKFYSIIKIYTLQRRS